VSGRGLDNAPPWRSLLLRLGGPRSGSGYSVPNRHHLIGPIRPTRRHIAISPHGGLYAMPSLCGSAEATRKWFRAFTAHSFLACCPLRPRGVRHQYPELRRRHSLHRMTTGSALPTLPQSVPRGRSISWLHRFAYATACQVARPPVRIRLDRPAFGDFYFQAFNGSVSLPVAGYNYNSDWTPLLAGLSPAGMAASLAARSFATELSCPRHVRFTPDRDGGADIPVRRLRANNGLLHRSNLQLYFDHLIGAMAAASAFTFLH